MTAQENGNESDSFRLYDLSQLRGTHTAKEPAPHQKVALDKLERWYHSSATGSKGAILVLPTGGGKTFTACHFTCRNPLSDGYKVLWLAHTHHLLEQARNGFDGLVQLISEPKRKLSIRIVSGAIGHFPVHSIRPTDDVAIASLQTVARAVESQHESLTRFVAAAGGKLLVVFDEAHHSPAPSYRRLLQQLRDQCSDMALLGLTATPTYSDDKKRGWLAELFPQGIVHQELPQKLMAAGVLAKPRFEEARTTFEVDFTDREYAKWIGSNRDIPEDIVSELAISRARNEYIAGYYLNNRERFGKTIIFADRWIQCEAICAVLNGRGARADSIYSHVSSGPGTPEDRNRRTSSANAAILDRFRNGELDVLVNVRMLTEGTDVPDVRTVFLTRQTTSQILLTQMVGRALRGPQFGGTQEANIVSFIDDWKQRIHWAAYDLIAVDRADDTTPEYGTRPPVQLISIELVRRLARQMDSGINVNPAPFREFLPVGWFRVEYETAIENSDDVELVRQLIMVFDQDKPRFDKLILAFKTEDLTEFENPSLQMSAVNSRIADWEKRWFSDVEHRLGVSLAHDIFSTARHLAQNDFDPPTFFPFERREDHDLDRLAQQHIDLDLGDRAKQDALHKEFVSQDRFWRAIYPSYEQFKSSYDGCINRILHAERHGATTEIHRPTFFVNPEPVPDREPSEELKEQTKRRDRHRCTCCGCEEKRLLEIDHTSSWYAGGRNDLDNLQTLCKVCNLAKAVEKINFRNNQTVLSHAPGDMRALSPPSGERAKERSEWEMFLRRTVNFFYKCSAVDSVTIGERGERLRTWGIQLFPGNDPAWLAPYLNELASRVRDARQAAGYSPAPDQITVNAIFVERNAKPVHRTEDTLTLKDVLEQIETVEGFEVWIEYRDGRKVRVDWTLGLVAYPYERAANGEWTVDAWKHQRFFSNYPIFEDPAYKVHVIDGNRYPCAGQKLLRTLRET